MESSTTTQSKPGFFTRQKNRISELTDGRMLELSLTATILFCFSFWNDLPDFNMNPVAGKSISCVGILILFGIIGYRLKWPVIIGVAGMIIYLGISFLQGASINDIASKNHDQHHSTFVNAQENTADKSINVTTYHYESKEQGK